MKKFISPAAREDILRQYRYLLMEQEAPWRPSVFCGRFELRFERFAKDLD